MPQITKSRFLLAGLFLLCSSMLLAQGRVPLTDLPPGLEWSTPLDHTDGQVYALLTSEVEGTYLVRGDSAVWMSPLVYVGLTSMVEGLRLTPPLGETSPPRFDSLVSAEGTQLIGANYSFPHFTRHTAGGMVMSSKSFYLENRDLILGRRSVPEGVIPIRQDSQSISYGVLSKLEVRACVESYYADQFEIGNVVWNGANSRMTLVYETINFDRTYSNGKTGKSIYIVTQGTEGEAKQSFSEINGELVSVVVNGSTSTIITTNELLEIDSLGRELYHAYLPAGYQPTGAIDGENGDVWLLDDGLNGKGRITQMDTEFEFVASYDFTNPSGTLYSFARRKVGGEISLVGYNPTGYDWVDIPLSNPISAGLSSTMLPNHASSKLGYPLRDTLPLVVFNRQYFTSNCDLSVFDTAMILKDSTIYFDIGGWTERRGRSGQWVASWADDFTESSDTVLPTGGFYRDSEGVRHTGQVGEPYILSDRSSATFKTLGEVSPGYALIEEESNFPDINVMNIRYSVYDSLGRRYVNLPVYRETYSSFAHVKQAGLLSYSDDTLSAGIDSYNRRIDIDFVPWELLQQPINPPATGCQLSKDFNLSWPDVPDYNVVFDYNGDGRMLGRFGSMSYWLYVNDSLSIDEALIDVENIGMCGDLVPGSVQLTHNPDYPNVISFLNGIQTDTLIGVYGAYRVQVDLLDTISGCESRTFLSTFRREFAFYESDACFGESGKILTFTGTDAAYLDFSDGTFEERRENLLPGEYPVTFRSSSGCSFDTTLVIEEALEIIPVLDSVNTNGEYSVSANILDTTYTYTFKWSNGVEEQSTLLPANARYALYTTQRDRNANCVDTLEFSLGIISSNTNVSAFSKLSFSIDQEGSLMIIGLEELSLKHGIRRENLQIQLLDASGREIGTFQAMEEPLRIRRSSNHVFGPKFLSFGSLGGVGIVW